LIGFERSVAVVIGIDEYGRGIPSLKTAVNDARAVAAMLETRFGYVVHLLIEDVSLERLRTLFGQALRGEIGTEDRLLVYFAGHGVAMDGDDGPDGFLIPQDGRPEDPRSFLRMTELAAYLDELRCRHLLLILDCCFAGAFRWSSTRDLGTLPEIIHKERYRRYIEDRAWQALTSAAHDQKALDVLAGETIGERGHDSRRLEHSPFATALLKALEGEADLVPRPKDGRPGGDGVITATELYLYLRESVEDGVGKRGHRQTPGLWPLKKHDKGEFIHLVVPGQEPELPPAPELTDEKNPWRGLESYNEEQEPLYFGRRRVIRSLHERVCVHPLTIVLGASGTGKSSLVKAGWLPRIRRIRSGRWRPVPPIRPGKAPLTSLASMVLPGEAE